MQNKGIDIYIRRVRRYLPCDQREKNRITAEISNMVSCYLETNPLADYNEIENHFGMPEQIALTYAQELEGDNLLSRLQCCKRIIQVVSIAAVAVVLIWGLIAGSAWLKYANEGDGYHRIELFDDSLESVSGGETK